MKDGFITAATATPAIRVADCAYNAQQIIALLGEAGQRGVKVLAFPELTVTGYTCGDLFLQSALLDGAEQALAKIAAASADTDLLAIVGLPLRARGKLYNCAAVINRGRLLGVVPKTNLPAYSEFYEARHFTPADDEMAEIELLGARVPFGSRQLFACRELPELKVGVEICEDLWAPEAPSQALALAGATMLVNLSASDEVIGKADYRRTLVSAQSGRLAAAYLYVDAGEGESTTDLVFSGHSLIAENGAILAESKPFAGGLLATELDIKKLAYERRRLTTYPREQEGFLTIPFSVTPGETRLTRAVSPHPFVPQDAEEKNERCESILAMQTAGLKTRLRKTGPAAVAGISGGLDSCLALLVTVRAFAALNESPDKITAVTMPCFGTSGRTLNNARRLCGALGVTLREIDITAAVEQHFRDIGHDAARLDVVYENAQARERTQVLMDIANQVQGIVVGTGDLSELALGWATYNGDHMSMYGVNASIPKTLVRHLVRYAAETTLDHTLRETLLDILATPVSPELLPAKDGAISQITEDIVGPYELHDFFLYYMARWAFPPTKIFRLAQYAFNNAYDNAALKKWLVNFYRRFFAQQFKRSCLPDGPKVGTVTLSPRGDWRMPSDAYATLWLAEAEAIEV